MFHHSQASTRMHTPFHRLTLVSTIALMMALIVPATNVCAAQRVAKSLYTFAAFTNSSQSQLYIYQSTDGLHFPVRVGPVYTPPTPDLLRDPSIIHYKVDGRYYITYTTAWKGHTIGIASSADLIHWKFLKDITLPSAILVSWAPEWLIDTDGSVNIIVNLNSTNTGDANFIPQKITALDKSLISWSNPTPLKGLSPNYIDTFVVKIGSTYHAFVKNETTKYIEHATAKSLTGPYSFGKNTGDWAGWGNNLEGPTVFQLDNGSWRIFMDGYASHEYYYSDSSDNFQHWTPKIQLPALSGTVRHGTVLREV